MAIYHLHAQVIGRSKGRSSVAAAAYRAACVLSEQIIDKETGFIVNIEHDYSHKHGVIFSKILAPENAPEWCHDRETLWNKIQNEFEKRKDAQFCREIDIALPKEMSEEQNIRLLTEFVNESFVKEGMIADVNFHNDNPENPHAHIMLSTREIVEGDKGEYTFGKKVTHWNSNEFLVHTRRMWAGFINKHLELAGIDQDVSHLSHAERGVELTPTIKEGLARFVEGSERSEFNKKICAYNEELIRSNPELIIDKHFKNKIVFTKEEIAKELFNIYTATVPVDMEGRATYPDETNNIENNNNNNSSSPAFISSISELTNEQNQQKILSDYICALDRVMSGDKIAVLQARDINGKQLYTTKNRLDLEKSFLDIANSIKQGEQLHQVNITDADLDKKSFSEDIVEKVKQTLGFDYKKVNLSQQQRLVVLEVLKGGNVSVIEGLPGAGKTTTMREVVRQYKKSGYRVQGAAVSSSAARELAKSAGIDAVNITKLRHKLDYHAGREFKLNLEMDYFNSEVNDNKRGRSKSKLTAKDVLIVDESSMVDLTEMHYILREVQRGGAKLILLGDSNQLPSVGTQGAAEKMAEMFGVSRLNEVKRQKEISHRNATELLSKFKVAEAIELYRKSSVFSFSDTTEKAKDALVRDYVKEYVSLNKSSDKENQVLSSKIAALAYTNKDIASLNNAIRTKLVDEGIVRGKEYKFEVSREGERAHITLAKGDQVVFTRNSRFLGVANSEVGEVIGFSTSKKGDRDTIIIKVAEGKGSRVVEVDNFHYKGFDYGYAVNVYKAQGKTYDSVKGLIDGYTGYNVFNVMATRHAYNIKLYASDDILRDELFKKISLDSKQAATEFEIKSSPQDSESARYAGLVAIVQKRGDTSFAADYGDKGRLLSREGEVIERYVEVRNEVIKVRQAIDHWIEIERAKGKVRSLYDTPYTDDLKVLLEERQVLAVSITDNYDEYKKLLTQAKINYNTIEKHAGKGEYQYSFSRLDYNGSIRDIKGLSEILDIQEKVSKYEEGSLFAKELKESTVQLHEISGRLHLEFEEHKLAIFKARTDLHKATDDKYRAQTYIEDGKRYIDKSFNEYLGSTYKASAEEILKCWEGLKEEKGLEKALAIVKNNPQALGKLKGVGLGTFLAFTGERMRANENSEVLQDKFRKYEEYQQAVPEKGKELARGEYDNQITEKEIAVKTLEARLPSKSVQDYIARAYKASMADNSNTKDKEQKVVLTWAKDNIVKAQSDKYRELLKGGNKDTQAANKYIENERNAKEYLKEREALLAQYEYSRGIDDKSKLYRNIAGAIQPDLAYEILKNVCFKAVEGNKARFIILNDNLGQTNKLTQVKDALLESVQSSVSFKVQEVQLLTREESRAVSIREGLARIIDLNLRLDVNNSNDKYQQILTKAEEYVFEHMAIDSSNSKEKPSNLSNYLQKRIVERAAYEVDSKEGWLLTLKREYLAADQNQGSQVLTAGKQLHLEVKAGRLASIEARLLQEGRLTGKEINIRTIERQAYAMEAEREEKIKAVLNNDKNVADLMKEHKGAAYCLAEQIVDYGLKHGEERLGQMSSTQINIMKEVALKQSMVADSIVKDLVSPSIHKGDKIITKDIIRKDTAGVIEWAKDGLNKAITKEFAISRLEKLDIAKAQGIINNQAKSAIKQLEVMQQQFKRERISEIDNNKSIELNRNKGLEFEK